MMNNRWLRQYAEWVTTHRWLTLGLLLLITVFFGAQLPKLQTNATPYFFDRGHPSRVAEDFVRANFLTSGESLFISVVTKEDSIFNAETLQRLAELTAKIEVVTLTLPNDQERLMKLVEHEAARPLIAQILEDGFAPSDYDAAKELLALLKQDPSVNAATLGYLEDFLIRIRPVVKVRSIVTVESVTEKDGELDIHPMMYRVPKTEEAQQALREEALGNRLLLKGLFTQDGKATNVQVELTIPQDDSPNLQRVYQAIETICNAMVGNETYHLGGSPVVTTQTALAMEQDNAKLFPGVVLIVMLMLLVTLRSVKGVVLPLVIAILAVLWTLGAMALAGVKQNIVSTMLPVFLISIGVADGIHFIADYYDLARSMPRREALKLTLRKMFAPVLITALTTIAGFLTLSYTDIRFVREFGYFVAVGVFFAFVLTVSLLPAVLAFDRDKKAKEKPVAEPVTSTHAEATAPGRFGRALLSYDRWIAANRFGFAMVLMLVVALCVWSVRDLRVDNQAIGYFDDDSRIRIDDAVINQHFGGSMLMNLTFKGETPGMFKDPALINTLARIEERLLQNPDIGYVYGMPDFLKLINKVLNDNNDDLYVVPSDSPDLIAQYLFLYESSNGRGLFDVVDPKFQNARLVIFSHTDRSSTLEKALDDILPFARSVLPPGITVEPSGFGEILVTTKNEVIYGQLASLSLSFCGVFLLLILTLRSWQLAVLGCVPMILTVLINFALMPRLGMDLDIGTAIVAAIVESVGYAIYLLANYQRQYAAGRTVDESIRAALNEVYKPIVFNTLVVGLGFLVLILSSFEALVNLGWLVANTMFVSSLLTLLVVPGVLRMIVRLPAMQPTESLVEQRSGETV